MQKVWKADDEFIDEMNQDTDEPMAPIAGKLIQLKKTGEQLVFYQQQNSPALVWIQKVKDLIPYIV